MLISHYPCVYTVDFFQLKEADWIIFNSIIIDFNFSFIDDKDHITVACIYAKMIFIIIISISILSTETETLQKKEKLKGKSQFSINAYLKKWDTPLLLLSFAMLPFLLSLLFFIISVAADCYLELHIYKHILLCIFSICRSRIDILIKMKTSALLSLSWMIHRRSQQIIKMSSE